MSEESTKTVNGEIIYLILFALYSGGRPCLKPRELCNVLNKRNGASIPVRELFLYDR